MTTPIQAATVAALNSDRRSWKAHNSKEGETGSRGFAGQALEWLPGEMQRRGAAIDEAA